MKYTSRLEDAFLECQNCKKCKDLKTCENSMPGFVYTPVDAGKVINFSYDACPKKQKEITDNEYKNNNSLDKNFDTVTFVIGSSYGLSQNIKRWKIENEGFNNQKNGLYQIQHLNSRNSIYLIW